MRRAFQIFPQDQAHSTQKRLVIDQEDFVDDSCSGYALLHGEKAPDDALVSERGAMGPL